MQIHLTADVPSADSTVDFDPDGIEFEAEIDASKPGAVSNNFENVQLNHSQSLIIASSELEGENVK